MEINLIYTCIAFKAARVCLSSVRPWSSILKEVKWLIDHRQPHCGLKCWFRMIFEVKQRWAWFALGWVTSWVHLLTLLSGLRVWTQNVMRPHSSFHIMHVYVAIPCVLWFITTSGRGLFLWSPRGADRIKLLSVQTRLLSFPTGHPDNSCEIASL